jgi:succinyl-diaminopimelate desuccinylase
VPTADADAQRILDHVEQHRDELVSFLVDLVRIRSVFPPGHYDEIAPRVADAFRSVCARTSLIAAPRDRVEAAGSTHPRPNVVATLGSGARPVLLIGTHLDVVGEDERADWSHDPFAGEISDGKVWGRGTCDAKNSLAAQVFAARALVECGFTLDGTLLLIASVDDEAGYDRLRWPGMTFLVEEGLASDGFPLPDMAINAESSGLDEICGSFKGRTILEIPVLGEIAHAGTPYGVNAVDAATTLIARLKQIPLAEHELHGPETLTICAVDGRAERYGDIPPICRVGVEIRGVPPDGTTRLGAAVQRVLQELADEEPRFRVGETTYVTDRPPFETPPDHALVGALAAAANQVGIDARYAGIIGTGELQPLVATGIPSVTYGAGTIDRVHRPDEYIEIDELVKQTQIYALAAVELCGGRMDGT